MATDVAGFRERFMIRSPRPERFAPCGVISHRLESMRSPRRGQERNTQAVAERLAIGIGDGE